MYVQSGCIKQQKVLEVVIRNEEEHKPIHRTDLLHFEHMVLILRYSMQYKLCYEKHTPV